MVFIDTVVITVMGGSGGNTVIGISRNARIMRKLYVSYGGNGGDVWLITDNRINTLNHFMFKKEFFAESGQNGRKHGCRGKSGKSIFIQVPLGTRVYDQNTHTVINDLVYDEQKLMLVKGGRCGFLSSGMCYDNKYYYTTGISNNYSRRMVHGSSGEKRTFKLELLLFADVGVLGLPNVGKSTFVRCVSSSKTKVGQYPFTTLSPSLGVVYIRNNSFVIADIPGLIKGASLGLGLGFSFLKHLQRCRMLLHFVDLVFAKRCDILENIEIIVHELKSYGRGLSDKPVWLVFNKIDLLNIDTLNKKVNDVINSLNWKGRYYLISSKCNYGVKNLCYDLLKFIK